jgi:hypothetical protein
MEGVSGSIPLPPTIEINLLDLLSCNRAHVSPMKTAEVLPATCVPALPLRLPSCAPYSVGSLKVIVSVIKRCPRGVPLDHPQAQSLSKETFWKYGTRSIKPRKINMITKCLGAIGFPGIVFESFSRIESLVH